MSVTKLFLIFCLLWSLATAPVEAEPVTVTVLMPAVEVVEWAPLVADFNRERTDIQIQMLEGPVFTDQLESLYTTALLLGKSPYDVMNIDVSWLPKFAAAGWLLDLNPLLSPQEQGEFLSPDLEGGRFQNGLYRLPTYTGVGLLYYRQDLLQEAGLPAPATFDDLLRDSQTLQSQGKVQWGYLWQGKQYEGLAAMFLEVLTGFGGVWVNPDSLTVGLDTPESIKALEFLQTALKTGVSPPGSTAYAEEDTRYLFQAGKALFLRNWPYAYPLLNAKDSPVAGKFAVQGMVHQPGSPLGACQGGWGLGISSQSPHPEAAWEVVRYLTNPDVQKQFALKTGKIPARKALFQDPEILAQFPYYSALYPILEQATLRPPITQYAQASDILQRYLSAALTEKLTASAALTRAAAETRQLLTGAGS
ncbi:MAG: ABC transporter substrate-binding protein [Cyanobacteriota bacterium]|nr:ABC transporter substrate-binding protein [Cyanobacteriota bacterium]